MTQPPLSPRTALGTASPPDPAIDPAVAAGARPTPGADGDLPELGQVHAAADRLAQLETLGVHDHPAVFTAVHDALAAALEAADDAAPSG